jgi:hypothetical protein
MIVHMSDFVSDLVSKIETNKTSLASVLGLGITDKTGHCQGEAAMHAAMKWITVCGIAMLGASCSPEPRQIMKISTIDVPSAITAEKWQDVATNVQDWDRAAAKIAKGLEDAGMFPSPQSPAAARNAFFIKTQQHSTFLSQLQGALETEITNRGGTISASAGGAFRIDLRVDVVQWGSGLYLFGGPRFEAVWQATMMSGDRIVLSFREPFYISGSDVSLYQIVSRPDEDLARNARRLRYMTQ